MWKYQEKIKWNIEKKKYRIPTKCGIDGICAKRQISKMARIIKNNKLVSLWTQTIKDISRKLLTCIYPSKRFKTFWFSPL